MSALEILDAPPRRPRATVQAVSPVKRHPGLPKGAFPLMILGLLAMGMVGHLALQTAIQENGFELGELQSQTAQLSAQEAVLQSALGAKSTPTQLAHAAAGLGMVADPYATMVVLSTGQVLGVTTPVTGQELPLVSAAPHLGASQAATAAATSAMGSRTQP
ncbi:MAG: hypothetical protein LBV00_02465 [Propionibacteriaceae bacterium]|jgi:hypothetical protein|nr:hypothetical protein [Propionibacteriaceae bacterium]